MITASKAIVSGMDPALVCPNNVSPSAHCPCIPFSPLCMFPAFPSSSSCFRISSLHCPKSLSSHRSRNPSFPFVGFPSSSVRYSRNLPWKSRLISALASAAGSSGSEGDFSPYEVLGVSSIEGFDMINAAYTRKRKDAERRDDAEAAVRLEKAYDKVMMAQLTNRKKGVTFGSFKVPKDVKFADKEPIVPWGPRFTRSSSQDMKINLAIAAVFSKAQYKPLQFLALVFVYRIFEKLKAFEPPASPTFTEDGEDPGRGLRMGKRLLRSLALAFGCITFASLAYTGILNLIEFVGGYVPLFLYNNQELLVTVATAIMLYIMASYYR